MNNNRDRVLSYTEEFSKKYGYTPTTFQISNELYIPHDKVSSIIEALRAEGALQISRPLSKASRIRFPGEWENQEKSYGI